MQPYFLPTGLRSGLLLHCRPGVLGRGRINKEEKKMSKLGHCAKGILYGTMSAINVANGAAIKCVAGVYDKLMGNQSHSKEAFELSKFFLEAARDEFQEARKDSW